LHPDAQDDRLLAVEASYRYPMISTGDALPDVNRRSVAIQHAPVRRTPFEPEET